MSFFKNSALMVFSLAIVTSCDTPVEPETRVAPSFNATSFKNVEVVPFEVPYYLDCLDEEVIWSGTVVFTEQLIVRPDGTTRLNGKAELLPGSVMSGVSGDWINPRVRSSYHFDNIETLWDNKAFINERITWENSATGILMDVRVVAKVVIAGNGDAKIEIPYTASCSLRK